LEASHRLEIVEGESALLGEAYGFNTSNGHTPGQMHTRIETPKGPVTFAGDLIPGVPWVHLPITVGYDRFPELLIEEKQTALEGSSA
jgi:glyoxylase-like metal-dependent hydrolase (beta-lactamase superfamily II)